MKKYMFGLFFVLLVGWCSSKPGNINNKAELTTSESCLLNDTYYETQGIAMEDRFSFDVKGKYVTINGVIDQSSACHLGFLIDENPKIKTLIVGKVLWSVDGKASINLGKFLRKSSIKTVISAWGSLEGQSFYLFLGWVERRVENDEEFRFEVQWRKQEDLKSYELPLGDQAHLPYVEYVANMLGETRFYWFLVEKAGESSYDVSLEELKEYRIVSS